MSLLIYFEKFPHFLLNLCPLHAIASVSGYTVVGVPPLAVVGLR